MVLTEQQLKKIMPHAKNAGEWVECLNQACERFEINTVPRMSAFLANIAVESGELARTRENLNYSAERLVQVFPRRFQTLEAAAPFAHNPQALADAVYCNKLGNGPDATPGPDDGFEYLGRGLIQLTGKENYRAIGIVIEKDIVAEPELLEQKEFAALSAAGYWYLNDINNIADTEDLRAVRKRVNAACLGLAEVKQYYARAKEVLGNE